MDQDAVVRELYAREQLRELRYAYAHHLDAGEWDAWGSLFAPEARFEVHRPVPPGDGPWTVRGREAITEFGASAIADAFEYSAHMMHNPRLAVDDDAATGRWYFDVFAAKPNGHVNWHQGIYEDDYRRVDGEWRFESVVVTVRAESEDVIRHELDRVGRDGWTFPSVRFPE
jgi:3-phenylpropionate/cinnamic acid dioxygenase small subunit